MGALMAIDRIPDWDRRIARQDAFWDRAIIDRPVVCIEVPKPAAQRTPAPPKDYGSTRERWMDAERAAEEEVAHVLNTEYLGDALPRAWPNLGPEVFAAFFGVELEYTDTTSWAKPVIEDWAETGHVRLSRENPYWRKLEEMTDALLEAGQGIYYTGVSDLHPGGDALASFRDPMDLNTDLLLYPDAVHELLDYVNQSYFGVFDYWHGKLSAAGQACTCWAGIVSSRKWYVPSNDFSCMVSEEMFEEFFLPGIAGECRFLDASLYHLDGPGALRHLDALLSIPELDAVQWVYGAGNGRASDWTHVYQRCQSAGKGVQVSIEPDELDWLITNLRPEGAWVSINGVQEPVHAEALLKRIAAWR